MFLVWERLKTEQQLVTLELTAFITYVLMGLCFPLEVYVFNEGCLSCWFRLIGFDGCSLIFAYAFCFVVVI